MVNKIPAKVVQQTPFSKWELTIKEIFSFAEFYRRLHTFLVDEGWYDLTGRDVNSGGKEFEDYFFQRKTDGLQFNTIWWRATKRPDFSGNNYYQFYVALDISVVAMKDTEIMHNGVKVKLQDGEMRINISLFLSEGDTSAGSSGDEWKSNSMLSIARALGFWKRDNPQEKKRAEAELIKFNNDLYELIQTYTGVKRETVKDFFPSKGIHH